MSTPFKTTPARERNLITLANYLLALPKDYKEFNMLYFYDTPSWGSDWSINPHEIDPVTSGCGAIACAVGHAPSAGIKPFKSEDWDDYSTRTLIHSNIIDEWKWCFSGYWYDTDNTPKGAGKRILWLLEKGLPDNWEDQMHGEDDLCYLVGE